MRTKQEILDGIKEQTIDYDFNAHLEMRDESLLRFVVETIHDDLLDATHDDLETLNWSSVASICDRFKDLETMKTEFGDGLGNLEMVEDLNRDFDCIVNDIKEDVENIYSEVEETLETIDGTINDIGERAYHLERYGTQEEKDKFIEEIANLKGLASLEEVN